jgi:hypothetical protein
MPGNETIEGALAKSAKAGAEQERTAKVYNLAAARKGDKSKLEKVRKTVTEIPIHLVPDQKEERPVGVEKLPKQSFWKGIFSILSKNEKTQENFTKEEAAIDKGFKKISVMLGMSVQLEYYKELDLEYREKHGIRPDSVRFYEDFYYKSILPAYRELFDPKEFIENDGFRVALFELSEYISKATHQEEGDIVQKEFETTYRVGNHDYRIVCESDEGKIVDIKIFREEQERDRYVFGSHLPLRVYAGLSESIINSTRTEYLNEFRTESYLSREVKRGGKLYDGSWGPDESDKFRRLLDQLVDIVI